jgi:hypothetical protein
MWTVAMPTTLMFPNLQSVRVRRCSVKSKISRGLFWALEWNEKIFCPGLDVALEALRLARQRKRLQNRELLQYARLLRVEKPMSPYLQAIE